MFVKKIGIVIGVISLILSGCGGGGSSPNSVAKDTTPPQITIIGKNPDKVIKDEAYFDKGATATDAVDPSVFVTHSGDVNTSEIGSYKITYSAVDKSGNKSTVVRTVNVVEREFTDTAPPVISLIGANPDEVIRGKIYFDKGATATDTVDPVVSVTRSSEVNTSEIGSYKITYSAIDKSGNKSTVVRIVNVVEREFTDTTPPVISLIGASVIGLEVGESYTEQGATVRDDTDSNLTIETSGAVNTAKVGIYEITYSAVDASGNKASIKRTIRITEPVVAKTSCSSKQENIAEINVNGNSSGNSSAFNLKKGLSIITLGHSGGGYFSASLRNSATNDRVGFLANEIGYYNGSTSIEIKADGSYYLDIDANDGWTAKIDQPRLGEADRLSTVSGTGDAVSRLFYLNKGVVIVALKNTGESNFSTVLKDNNGKAVEYLANEIGNFDGAKLSRINISDCYLLNIDSNGTWVAEITQPSPATAPETKNFSGIGQQVTNPFFITAGTHSFTISHQGSGHFSVVTYNKQGNAVSYLVNEIGDVNVTFSEEVDTGGIHFIQISADNESSWTVRID